MRKNPRLDGEEKWGICNYTDREIVISRETKQYGVAREILLHEVIHKCCPFLAEETVVHLARELDLVLDFAEHESILDI